MAVQQWTTNPFEMSPQDSDSPAEGAQRIRELKETAGSLLDKEHKARDAGSVAAQGWHRSGSAITYYTASEPTTRPDETTALDASDAGRLWVDSGTGLLQAFDGSAWEDVITDQSLKAGDNVTFGEISSGGIIASGSIYAGGDISAAGNTVMAATISAGTLLTSGVSGVNPTLTGGGRAAGFYTGSTSGATNYPRGTIIVANGGGDIPDRNATVNIRHTGDGAFTIGTGGTQLLGTWRARGGVIASLGTSVVLAQRTE